MKSNICLSLGHIEYNKLLEHLNRVALAEIRIDLLNLTHEQLKSIFEHHKNLIATYRPSSGDFEKMTETLITAIESGCAYIDIDIETPPPFVNKLIELGKKYSCTTILSNHNFDETPNLATLNSLIGVLFNSGADIAKIACKANAPCDCARIMGLYENNRNLIAFCMGELGKITRLAAPFLGAPFTYASLNGTETAPGQMQYDEMEELLKNFFTEP